MIPKDSGKLMQPIKGKEVGERVATDPRSGKVAGVLRKARAARIKV
jgi:hypothetical protein